MGLSTAIHTPSHQKNIQYLTEFLNKDLFKTSHISLHTGSNVFTLLCKLNIYTIWHLPTTVNHVKTCMVPVPRSWKAHHSCKRT